MSWQDRAACRGMSWDLFFPSALGLVAEAKTVCMGCEVRTECHTFACSSNRGNREQFGIWGGKDFEESSRSRRITLMLSAEMAARSAVQ